MGTMEWPTVRRDVAQRSPPAPTVGRGETKGSQVEHAGREQDEAGTHHPEASDEHGLAPVLAAVDARDFPYEVLGDHVVRVVVTAGDVVMAGVPLLEAAEAPTAILAQAPDGTSAILMREGPDLYVVRRSPGVWEHFRAPGGPSAVIGSWRSGERARFRQRHGALWMAIPAARDLAQRLGAAEHLPAETPPPPPATTSPSRPRRERPERPAATRRPPAKKAEPTPPPAPKVCPRCFMELPASGVCDC